MAKKFAADCGSRACHGFWGKEAVDVGLQERRLPLPKETKERRLFRNQIGIYIELPKVD